MSGPSRSPSDRGSPGRRGRRAVGTRRRNTRPRWTSSNGRWQLASVGSTGDPNDGADVISPFGIGEGGVRVEDLDDARFVTRSPLGVLGRSLIDGDRRLAHLFGALVQRRLVVLDLRDQQGAGRRGLLKCFFDNA